MNPLNTGGPAFPTPEFYDEKVIGCEPGMSLRDWFAGMALQGVLAFSPEGTAARDQFTWSGAAREAYGYADAMLEARAKRPEGGAA